MTSDNHVDNTLTAPTNSGEVIDLASAKLQNDKKRYRLEFPIHTEQGELSELWLRRPTVRDKQVAEWQSDDNAPYEVTLRLLAAITEQPLEVIEELDAELDMVEMLSVLNKSFKDKPSIDGNTLLLKYPIVINGKPIDRLTLQRPKAKDALQFKDEKVSDGMARLVGYRIEDLLGMDLLTDWLGLEQVFNTFRKKQPQRKQS